jgi:hypothetical protein
VNARRPLCANPDLLTRIAEAQQRSERYPDLCKSGASRRISVIVLTPSGGWTGLQADVCLWHSLVHTESADELLYARLIRVLDNILTRT